MEIDYKKYVWMIGGLTLFAASFALVSSGMKDFSDAKHVNGQTASITVSGEGEVVALPDIATITLTVREAAKTVPEAQKLAESKVAKVLADLSLLGIDKKDTKTISYTINPKYEQQAQGFCVGYQCPPTKTVVVGYEITETMQIKVRKIDQSGAVIGAIGKENVTEMSGPEFSVENPDKAKEEAKALAIAQAMEKAKATASSLHTKLGDIMSFSENGGNIYPVMYGAGVMSAKMDSAVPSVTVPEGESVIKAQVTITYSLE